MEVRKEIKEMRSHGVAAKNFQLSGVDDKPHGSDGIMTDSLLLLHTESLFLRLSPLLLLSPQPLLLLQPPPLLLLSQPLPLLLLLPLTLLFFFPEAQQRIILLLVAPNRATPSTLMRGEASNSPFSLLLLFFNFMRGDVRSKEVTALVEQLDKLHHGLLSVHVTKGGPLFSAHTAKVKVKTEGRKWQFWESRHSCTSSQTVSHF